MSEGESNFAFVLCECTQQWSFKLKIWTFQRVLSGLHHKDWADCFEIYWLYIKIFARSQRCLGSVFSKLVQTVSAWRAKSADCVGENVLSVKSSHQLDPNRLNAAFCKLDTHTRTLKTNHTGAPARPWFVFRRRSNRSICLDPSSSRTA